MSVRIKSPESLKEPQSSVRLGSHDQIYYLSDHWGSTTGLEKPVLVAAASPGIS